jgi:hypothetical protein
VLVYLVRRGWGTSRSVRHITPTIIKCLHPLYYNTTHTADSPAHAVKSDAAWRHYSIGPPYIAHKHDLAAIARHWHDFVPRVYEGHPHLLAEMYAYCVAAAHLRLPHLRLDHYMTSETESYGEAWPLVDALGEEELCAGDLSERTRALPVRVLLCVVLCCVGVFWGGALEGGLASGERGQTWM